MTRLDMKFQPKQFSKRFPAVTCALFIVHESAQAYREYRGEIPPSQQAARHRATGAAIILPTGMVYVGMSICSPEDPFVKATGRQKAIGRAYQRYRGNFGQQLIYSEGYSFIEAVKGLITNSIDAKKHEMGLL